jgi:glutamate-ammonia-ligase adenylyltransferase
VFIPTIFQEKRVIDAASIDGYLDGLPELLRVGVDKHWTSFRQALVQDGITVPADTVFLERLCRVWAVSEFAALSCTRQPSLLLGLLDSGDLDRRYDPDSYFKNLKDEIGEVTSAENLGQCLRRFRQREMVRITWRDIAGMADVNETMTDLSALADACIQHALSWLHQQMTVELGMPQNAEGQPQQMVVLGMGKLGAGELNFSSDVDLIFVYPEAGETHGGKRPLSNEQFFARLGKSLIKALDENTAEGFVFRVDMRLRPFGQSGALVCSFQAMENYYQAHGRDWERYALVKARVVAGDQEQGAQLFDMLRPFVYRRYLDFGAFEALREMKKMVEAEVKRKGMANHVKLGAGGIREVEFIGQAFQLIRGGREPELQQREIQRVLAYLAEKTYLPEYVVQQLLEAYVFLRNTEHRLQEFQDQQTHRLPDDELGRQRLAFGMGYGHWDEFIPVLRAHMVRVHSHFEQVFEAPQVEHAKSDTSGLTALWLDQLDEADGIAVLKTAGYEDAAASWTKLKTFREMRCYQSLSRTGRGRMDRLVPLMLGVVAKASGSDVVLQRLIALLESIARRSAYLSLLIEHPLALSQLVRLCAASPWISQLLVKYPLLLDELLDPRSLYQPPDRLELEADLKQRLAHIDDDDLEQAMDVMRQFKQASVLRVAAADVVEAVPLMQVSNFLTDIAEVILECVLDQAWADLVARHGYPGCATVAEKSGSEKGDDSKGFAVLAYGKLGGYELGYGSDLDLVFVHNSDSLNGMTNAMTDGAKPVADAVFFARLGQRMIHIMTAHTPAGILYEVDMRLRPSGASGLLVTSLSSFADYQKNKAWTWEHQALVRARIVAGDSRVGKKFEVVRREVLSIKRVPAELRKDINDMRQKMRESLDKSKEGEFDLKHGVGGIADIEFMVQCGVLSWACDTLALTDFTDNIRLLASFAQNGKMLENDVTMLSDAYRIFRAEVHRLTLQERSAIVSDELYVKERANVKRLWHEMFEADSLGL